MTHAGRAFPLLASLLTWSLAPFSVFAQAPAQGSRDGYPNKPMRMIVPNPAGGGVDILARTIGQPLSEKLGQPVTVDNRPGAGGTIGTGLMARSAPDGYTLGMVHEGTLAIAPALYRSVPYDPIKDFSPITLIAKLPLILAVHPSLPVKTVRDLIALARARPGQIDYASGGNGTAPQLAAEVFKIMAKVKINHVPFKGGPPALIALVAGEVPVMFINMLPGLPYIKNRQLRPVAVTSERRSAILPDIPSIKESGLRDYNVVQWYGIVVPSGTPAAIVARLNREIRQILDLTGVKVRLQGEGAELAGSTPEAFSAYIRSELAHWGKAVRDSGAKLD
ncbi:MAG: tripartite tricarboxylate transporter substrate binding protein [Betaproteobacteria bacterium]|nr:tripartite tricarboxylate transporter substrate binding protein [Betaproteobacteria bacterium]